MSSSRLDLHPEAQTEYRVSARTSSYLVKSVSTLGIIERNQALVAEAHRPPAAVQVRHRRQLLTQNGHQTSSRETKGKRAGTAAEFLLSPRRDETSESRAKLGC